MHDLDRTYMEDREGLELDADADLEAGDYTDGAGEAEGLDEDQVTELAAELLAVASDPELDQFLGGLLDKAASALGGALGADHGHGIGGILKGIARTAIPMIANAYAPGSGAAVTSLLGLELEGLSPEDQEFEAAKQYVRLGAEAVKQALAAPDDGDPHTVAQAAMRHAAQQFAPGLLHGEPTDGAPAAPRGQRGQWFRRGNHIVLQGL